MEHEPRTVRVDRLKLLRLRLQFGFTIDDFEAEARIDSNTAKKLLRGGPVSITTLRKAASAFKITNHHELLHPEELAALGVDPALAVSTKGVLEWDIQRYVSLWDKTANGLQYCVAKLQHRYLPTRYARGKCYWLQHLRVGERQKLEEHLRRHCEVCERVNSERARKCPNIAKNITATFVEDGGMWWILDEWEEGPTLADCLKDGPLDAARVKNVMSGIAEGLAALHNKKVIRRQLSPRFVIVRSEDQCPVLTDFELAKLLDGKTVRPEDGWQEEPYRAIEVVDDRPVDERADVYSWGRIFVEAAIGRLPAKGEEAEHLKALSIPETLKQLVAQCVAKTRSRRPEGMAQILPALKGWKP